MDISWHGRAACAGDLKFTERSVPEQLKTCAGCLVRLECLEQGIELDDGIKTVVHGGQAPETVARLARERRGARRRPRAVAHEGDGVMWSVTVAGVPKPKGSLKCVGQNGRHQLIEDDKHGARAEWRRRVVKAASAVLDVAGAPLTGPVSVNAVFLVPKPKSAPRSRQWPTVRSSGDLDKLARLVLDAITDAGLWDDDSQCVSLSAQKRYMREGERSGMTLHVGIHS